MSKLFRKYGWQWTTWACGRALEVTQPCAKIMVEHGHEFACHGNRWRIHGENANEERAHIHKSFDRIQAATGLENVPTGWFIGNGGPRQKLVRAQVHKARDIPLQYCSDTYASDTPWWIPDPTAELYGEKDEGMLMIPYSLCTNDHRCELCFDCRLR